MKAKKLLIIVEIQGNLRTPKVKKCKPWKLLLHIVLYPKMDFNLIGGMWVSHIEEMMSVSFGGDQKLFQVSGGQL